MIFDYYLGRKSNNGIQEAPEKKRKQNEFNQTIGWAF